MHYGRTLTLLPVHSGWLLSVVPSARLVLFLLCSITLIVRLELEGTTELAGEMLIISLTVGGGYGFLTGRYGLTIDNLIGATVVIADGRLLQVNKDKNQDVSSHPVSKLSSLSRRTYTTRNQYRLRTSQLTV